MAIPIIKIEPIKHKGQQVIALFFDYNKMLIELVRELPGRRWSKTKKCWHIPYTKQYKTKLKEVFNEIATIEFKVETLNTEHKHDPNNNLPQAEVIQKIESFKTWLKVQRYSSSTINTYISILVKFFGYFKDKLPLEINIQDIKEFNYEYILKKGYSASFQNQFINAVKKFYEKEEVLNLDLSEIERPRRGRRLPKVLSKEEVKKLLDTVTNIKHKTILSIIYATGLRRSEALNMKLRDIDSKRMIITIVNAKGNKDRIVGLSVKLLNLLREYYLMYKPDYYLFEGNIRSPYSGSSISMIFKRAKKKAGLDVFGGVHILRHSFATHLHESGYDIRMIQELLGHKSSKTTEIYTHISTKNIQNVKSPFDDF
ncbi:MAG: site-specific integrase [Bacteroidales bacterium]|nr:site-specific integrase [Bacteroidales bacterium]